MKLTLHLADAAQSDQLGKVSALGLGWSQAGTPLGPHALVLFVEVDSSETNRSHHFVIDLVTEDGHPATLNGELAFRGEGDITVGAPDAILPGATVTQAFAFPVPPGLPLPANRRWEYRVTVGDAVATVSFTTREGHPRP